MNRAIGDSRFWRHLPRAFITLSGLFIFHLLSGDSLASWSMLGIAVLALFARVSGSIKSRITRIELSIASTACVLFFLQGGFISHFNSLTLPLVVTTTVLLVGLNAVNLTIPQGRVIVVPILFILFFVSQRYFHPNLNSEFTNPLLTIGLLVAAWELLSSVVHTNRNSPTMAEAGVCIALLFFYHQETSQFPSVALLSAGVLLAYFFGAAQAIGQSDSYAVKSGIAAIPRNPLTHAQVIKSYSILFFTGLSTFLLAGWIIYARVPELPFLASVDSESKPLEVEQRNRIEQAFFSFKNTEPKVAEPLKPLNISILEDALRQRKVTETPTHRKVIVREANDGNRLNVDRRYTETIETTRISKIPSVRISPVPVSQPLPQYSLSTDLESSGTQIPSETIQYDFGINPERIEFPSGGNDTESVTTSSSGGPLRVDSPPPSTLDRPSPIRPPHQTARPEKPQKPGPRDVQPSVGFSPELEFADNVSTHLRSRPVLEVYLPGSSKWVNRLYLRFNTLEEVAVDRFVETSQPSSRIPITGQPGWNDAPGPFRSKSESSDPWTLALGYHWNGSIPLIGPFDSIRAPTGFSISADETSFTLHRDSGTGPFAYQFRGPSLSDTRPIVHSGLSSSERERLTNLPLSSLEINYLKRLGRRIGGNSPSPKAFANRAQFYFETNHPYSFNFKFKSGDEHLLISWLKAKSPGICGYYAGAFTLLARAQGIPARVVIGALTREFDPKSRKFIVRDRDAHAWAEYLNEKNEWVRADLTPIAIDSPRFASSESYSESYENNIQSALASLQNDIEMFGQPAVANSARDIVLPEADKAPNAIEASPPSSESIASALDLIDTVLERESEKVALSLDPVAAPVAEPGEQSTKTVPPQTEESAPLVQFNETISEREKAPDVEISETIPSELNAIADSELLAESWSLTPRVTINYLFALILIIFTFSQLGRIRKRIIEPDQSTRNLPLRDRAHAGRLLREIESFFRSHRELADPLHHLKQRAVQLRYSPHCSEADVRTLRREFRRSIAKT